MVFIMLVLNGYNNILPYEGALIYLNVILIEDKFLHFCHFNNAVVVSLYINLLFSLRCTVRV